jgi:F0F1-type ATP synthase delta subunit
MMGNLAAKKYASVLFQMLKPQELSVILEELLILSNALNNKKILTKLGSPLLTFDEKVALVLGSDFKNIEVINLVKLLIEGNKIYLIMSIYKELRLAYSDQMKQYEGVLYSNVAFDEQTVATIAKTISEKIGASITFKQQIVPSEGFKIEVADLNIELSFSGNQLKQQIINHIIKAL